MALVALLVLGLLPFLAGLAEVLAQPAALAEVLTSARLGKLLLHTLALGVVTAAASIALGAPAGRFLARASGRLRGTLALLLPLPLVLPPWMAGLAWSQLVPLRGFLGAAFLLTACLWPLVALFALRGFAAAARATDAARLLRGARAATWRVELPLALPSILAGGLLVFVFAITDFGVVDFLSFNDARPFVVLSSEVFQKWARLDRGPEAAAVSLAVTVPSALALLLVLLLERRHRGRFRGELPARRRTGFVSPAAVAGAGLLTATILLPLVVLVGWALGAEQAARTLAAARDKILTSVGVGAASALLLALVGVSLARLGQRLSPRREALLLGAVLLPLAAPAVMFAVGEIRVWNHPLNPLADAVYRSPLLLVLALSGRYLALGVLAARAVLARQDPAALDAARLVPRPRWQRMLAVELPLAAPALGLTASLGWVLALRELDMVVLIPAGSATLSHHVFAYVHIAADDVTAVLCLAAVLLVLLPAAAARLLGAPGLDCGRGPGPP